MVVHTCPKSRACFALSVALAFAFGLAGAADNPAAELEAPTVEVIGTTPIQGIGVPVSQVPANVQTTTGADIQKQKTLDLSEYLDNNLGGVTLNHGQNNPFQPDVNFRGLTASPLLGTPQGLSVFVDGVRVNEPFGDVVNWDLIPQNAISTVTLIPGSNPVFGLNTLGAALSVSTKSGFQYPGASVSLSGGSWGRKAAEVEYGAHSEKADLFLAGNFLDEDGWREHSPSRIKTVFGKVGWEREDTDVDVSLMLADNKLEGTQALPIGWLDTRKQAYTWPDRNENQVAFLNARASHFLTADRLLAGNVYYRRYTNDNFSSNVNNDCEKLLLNPFACAGGFASGEPQAFNDRSKIETNGYGGSLQVSLLGDLGGKKNNLTVGASADLGRTRFSQTEEEADFTSDRGTVGSGVTTLQTDVDTTNDYYGLYFTDVYSFSERWHLTLSGRYNWANVTIKDRTGLDAPLNGDHTFKRFNPAAGLNFNPSAALTTYVSYSEGMRAPTPIELTCADPAAPCRLPNNFLADPPLEKVVAKTTEIGARGRWAESFGWSAAAYRTDLNNDIIFISSGGAVNAGFFQNAGKTRRQGLELGIHGRVQKLSLAMNYGYIDAKFVSALTLNSPSNSSADANGDIQVSPGNKIPGIPVHSVKLRAEVDFTETVSMGTNIMFFSSQYARGDENNQDANGKVPGYTLVNLDARVQYTKQLMFFGRINNVFDKDYETLGVLGENFFNGPGRTFDASNVTGEQFRSTGAPRAFWVGVKYTMGQKP
ncbi:MAG: TonB-dependent receptor [Betaproteobacteria bacterium]|nr:TonB-dependent receptor [Betaproteobacteria bacterium]